MRGPNHSFIYPLLIAILLSAGGCVPPRSSHPEVQSGAATSVFTVNTVRVGPAGAYSAEIDADGNYFSHYSPSIFSGTCKGDITKINIEFTLQSGGTTMDSVNCFNETFTWNKSLATETQYTVLFRPMNGANPSQAAPVTKIYTFDITNPAAPVFLTPAMANTYTITNGTTQVTITGQVLKETTRLVGPYSINLPLQDSGDNIHKNFFFNATVPAGTTAVFSFTAYDAARNLSTNSMTIDSVLNLSIPVAGMNHGGSRAGPGLIVESTLGTMSGITVNQNVKQTTGGAGIIGNL